jgi:hypothetical protein
MKSICNGLKPHVNERVLPCPKPDRSATRMRLLLYVAAIFVYVLRNADAIAPVRSSKKATNKLCRWSLLYC